MPGIEPGAFHMQSERATTALHPLLFDIAEIFRYKYYARFILSAITTVELFSACNREPETAVLTEKW